MPRAFKRVAYPFINKGVVTKLNSGMLAEGQFRQQLNMLSLQEGALISRNGYQRLNPNPLTDETGAVLGTIHTCKRLVTGAGEGSNYRYLGSQSSIYRMTASATAFGARASATLGWDYTGKKWAMTPYRKTSSGLPYAYFATPSLMLKDTLTDNYHGICQDLFKWGIDRPCKPLTAVIYTTQGELKSSVMPYNWMYAYRNPYSGAISNPSMLSGDTVSIDPGTYPTGAGATLTIHAVCPAPQRQGGNVNPCGDIHYADRQLLGSQSIAIYRAGGAFADNYYRLVGYSDFPTNAPNFYISLSGDTVTAVTGQFDVTWPAGLLVTIAGENYHIVTVGSTSSMTIDASPTPPGPNPNATVYIASFSMSEPWNIGPSGTTVQQDIGPSTGLTSLELGLNPSEYVGPFMVLNYTSAVDLLTSSATPGTDKFNLWVKTSAAATVSSNVFFYDASGGAVVGELAPVSMLGGAWTNLSLNATPLRRSDFIGSTIDWTNITKVEIDLAFSGSTPAEVWVGGVSFGLGSTPPPSPSQTMQVYTASGQATYLNQYLAFSGGSSFQSNWAGRPVTVMTAGGPLNVLIDGMVTASGTNATIGGTGGTTLTAATPQFDPDWPAGTPIRINGYDTTIYAVLSTTQLIVASNVGVTSPVQWSISGLMHVEQDLSGYITGGSTVDFYVLYTVEGDVTYLDLLSDASIANADILDFDNDPPVTADLPIPFSAEITGFASGGTAGSLTIAGVQVNSGFSPGVNDLRLVLRPGSVLTITTSAGATEQVVLQAIPSAYTIAFYTVGARTARDYDTGVAGDIISCGSIANCPCDAMASAFNSMFLGGQADNQSTLYKSKAGRVEAWPVVNVENGAPGSIEVGSPSNPIVDLCEFSGSLFCLNKTTLFQILVYQDYMQAPVSTPSQRGLFAKRGWTRADNAIYYLSYDGVYAWSGNVSTKISEAIDPMFKGEYVYGYAPVSFSTSGLPSDLDKIECTFFENELRLTYVDQTEVQHQLRYHALYDRWTFDDRQVTAYCLEEDIKELVFCTNDSNVGHFNLDNVPTIPSYYHTTDAFPVGQPLVGNAINWSVWTGDYQLTGPQIDKQFSSFFLELSNPGATVTVQAYYDYSGTGDVTDVFTIAQNGVAGRRVIQMSAQQGFGKSAKTVSFLISGAGTAPTTLWSMGFAYFDLEEPTFGRAWDWDDLGYPHDKHLFQLMINYETGFYKGPESEYPESEPITMYLDTITGVAGSTVTLQVQEFDLQNELELYPPSPGAKGPVQAQVTIPIIDACVVKKIRLRPAVCGAPFKVFNYSFEKIDYPPDNFFMTEYSDLGYTGAKLVRELTVNVDTGGVPAKIAVQADGGTVQTFIVDTTFWDRSRTLTFSREIRGTLFRLVSSVGEGQKCQLFSHKFNWIPEPFGVTHWDSFEQAFGYNGWKLAKTVWVEYACCSPITVNFYCDQKRLLYTIELPAHEYREVEYFYLPVSATLANGSIVFNKSKTYRITADVSDPCCPLYMYKDATRVEVMPLAGDQRKGYTQQPLTETEPLKV